MLVELSRISGGIIPRTELFQEFICFIVGLFFSLEIGRVGCAEFHSDDQLPTDLQILQFHRCTFPILSLLLDRIHGLVGYFHEDF